MLFQNQALSVRTIEEYHFSAYFSQEIRVSATLVERCLHSMKSSRPPGDLRWNTLLAPKTESAAFLRYLISSVTPSITPPETERGSGNQPLVMSEKFYSRNKGKSAGGKPLEIRNGSRKRWVWKVVGCSEEECVVQAEKSIGLSESTACGRLTAWFKIISVANLWPYT